jgi:hypothetical protein
MQNATETGDYSVYIKDIEKLGGDLEKVKIKMAEQVGLLLLNLILRRLNCPLKREISPDCGARERCRRGKTRRTKTASSQ